MFVVVCDGDFLIQCEVISQEKNAVTRFKTQLSEHFRESSLAALVLSNARCVCKYEEWGRVFGFPEPGTTTSHHQPVISITIELPPQPGADILSHVFQ